MHEGFDTGLARGTGDSARAGHMYGLEGLPSRLGHDARKVDHSRGAVDGASNRIWKAHIGLHGIDLPDIAQRLQMSGQIGASHRRAHPPAIACKRLHRMSSGKTRPAEHGDHTSLFPPRRHFSPIRIRATWVEACITDAMWR